MQTAKVEPGSTRVVFGAGMVGLGAVAGCRLQGAERIIAVDLSPDRLDLARGQGATDVRVGGAAPSTGSSTRPAGSERTTRSRRPAPWP
jgi:Zn-dependent alcohol dehydrogenase